MKCKTCLLDKPVTEFYQEKRTKLGYRPHCKTCTLARQRTYEYKTPHKQPTPEVKRRSLLKNIEKRKAWEREYNQRPEVKARRNAYLNKTGKGRESVNRRRARKASAEGSHTEAEWRSLCEQYGNECIVPGCSRTDLTRDHIVPLARGGSDYIDNIQPMCKSHNSQKHVKVTDYKAS